MRTKFTGGLCIGLAAALCMTALIAGATGDSRVADAAMSGNTEAVRALLKEAVDVNAAQGDGMTALHWAALNGDADLAQLLLYAGANVKATTRIGGYTPLFMAAKNGQSAVIDVLLKAGADPKATALAGLTPLMMAASSGDKDSVSLLIEHGADVNAKESEHGQTPLAFAAAFNRAEAIQVLAEHGADVNLAGKVIEPPPPPQRGAPAGQGQAAAQGRGAAAPAAGARGGRGARGGQAPAAAATTANANGQAAAAPANSGRGGRPQAAPAAAAASGGNRGGNNAQGAQQQAQMNGSDAGSRGGGNPQGGLTPLMYAARQGSMDAVNALLNAGAKLDLTCGDKSTALLLAIINGHFDVAKVLVDHGADVNLPSMDGGTPLYIVANTQWARKSFHPQPTTKYEKTPYLDLMKDLLDHGADPNAKIAKELWYSEYNFSLESASAVGTTAFWKCAEVGDIDGMKLLVSRGADPNIASKDGVTPLLVASGAGVHGNDDVTSPYGRLAAVKYLVEELHADVNAADTGAGTRGIGGGNEQQLAVQRATEANKGKAPTEEQIQEQLKLIQQQQAQSGFARRGGGITALHNAAERGDNEMILYLVSKGAKVDAVANNGMTVVDKANGPRQRIQPYPETVALLEMLGAKNSHKCVSC